MNVYGKNWKINGLVAAVINRTQTPGQYIVKFDRDLATVEQIEAIDWMNLKVECLMATKVDILPKGYSFNLKDITYDNITKHFTAIIETDQRNFGDVKWYENEIVEINNAHTSAISDLKAAHKQEIVELNAEHLSAVTSLENEIDEKNAAIDNATSTITELNTALAAADDALIQLYETILAMQEMNSGHPAEPPEVPEEEIPSEETVEETVEETENEEGSDHE